VKVDIHSLWSDTRRRPNVYLYLLPENETERALMMSLYGTRPTFLADHNGKPMLDFFPPGDQK
jgi:hypothetical protein